MLVELGKELSKPVCVCPRCKWERDLWFNYATQRAQEITRGKAMQTTVTCNICKTDTPEEEATVTWGAVDTYECDKCWREN